MLKIGEHIHCINPQYVEVAIFDTSIFVDFMRLNMTIFARSRVGLTS
jgi:hypothetical protein